jgi:uncharacterized small protein (DUF1192 family)
LETPVTFDPRQNHMSDSLIAKRMDKLEEKVEALQSDMTEVKAGVKQLTNALSGDALQVGVIAELRQRIGESEKSINELNATCQYIQSKQFTQKDMEGITNLLSWFNGWKLVILTLIALVPTATLIFNAIKP